jgi:CelD/BcsL family acetyltransferase involved in cellulose biosynthesis
VARLVDRGRVTGLAHPNEVARDAPREMPGDIPADGTTQIVISDAPDFAMLEAKWRDLEARSNPSFFQSWTWTGCLAEERFPDPVLVEARENGRTVALALFNRRGRTLYLGESGDPVTDCIYVEFNGVLAESGREGQLTAACLGAARAWSVPRFVGILRRRIVLSGISSATAVSAMEIGAVRRKRCLPAPFVDVGDGENCFLESRSANTRHQLRRSDREYAATGAVTIDRADTLARAYEFLDGLATLHQASWVAREQPGAFANPFFGRFHRALIARGLERGEIDLLRIAAGSRTIGFVYNFRYRERSLAYQSGFDFAHAGRHGKPGLTCHHAAIRFAARWGASRYDFLAGDDRYKRSLSDRSELLHWIEVASPYSPRFLARRAWDLVTDRRPGVPAIARSPDASRPS